MALKEYIKNTATIFFYKFTDRSGKSIVFAIVITISCAVAFVGQSNILYTTSCLFVHNISSSSTTRTTGFLFLLVLVNFVFKID